MKSNECLTFHDFWGVITNRSQNESTHQHLKSCQRCQEELEFVRKIHHAINSQENDFKNQPKTTPLKNHIPSQTQEKYFQGTIGLFQRWHVHKHLTVCSECLHEFATAAQTALPALTQQDEKLIEQIAAAKVEDRLAEYRRYFMVQPSIWEKMLDAIVNLRIDWQKLSWGYKLGAAAAVCLLLFLGYHNLSDYITLKKAHTFFRTFIGDQFIPDDKLRPSVEVKFLLFHKTKSAGKEEKLATDPTPLLEALKISPNDVEINHKIGTFYFFNGQMELAEEYYRRALTYDQKNARIHNDLALIYFDRKDFSKALELLEQATALDANLLEAHYNKAMVLEFMKEKEKAIAAWEKYLDLDRVESSEWKRVAREHLRELSR